MKNSSSDKLKPGAYSIASNHDISSVELTVESLGILTMAGISGLPRLHGRSDSTKTDVGVFMSPTKSLLPEDKSVDIIIVGQRGEQALLSDIHGSKVHDGRFRKELKRPM